MNKRKQTTNEVSGYRSNEVGRTDGAFSLSAVPATSTRKPRTLGRRSRLSPSLSPALLDSAPPDALVTVSGVGGVWPRAVMLSYRVEPVPRREAPQVESEYPKLGVIIR